MLQRWRQGVKVALLATAPACCVHIATAVQLAQLQLVIGDPQCHTAVVGEECYEHVLRAMRLGMKRDPGQFPGLTNESSFEEFQSALHARPGLATGCRRPCGSPRRGGPAPAGERLTRALTALAGELCGTPVAQRQGSRGDSCYKKVHDAMRYDIARSPDRYPALTRESGVDDLQAALRGWDKLAGACYESCEAQSWENSGAAHFIERGCHTAVHGEQCHREVTRAMQHGILERPETYPSLTVNSSFEDFQMFLHQSDTLCPRPCQPEIHLALARQRRLGQVCHTAVAGEQCHEEVTWAMRHGILNRPHWYPKLTPESSFEEFQAFLHGTDMWSYTCPKPCEALRMETEGRQKWSREQDCHTAVEGEDCHREVRWSLRHGIPNHPEWYPALTPNSSFEDVQEYLHSLQPLADLCPKPCRQLKALLPGLAPAQGPPRTRECRTAAEGEDCHREVEYLMKEGIVKSPGWYPGLTPQSSFQDVQDFLHSMQPLVKMCPARACRAHHATTARTETAPSAPLQPAAAPPAAARAVHNYYSMDPLPAVTDSGEAKPMDSVTARPAEAPLVATGSGAAGTLMKEAPQTATKPIEAWPTQATPPTATNSVEALPTEAPPAATTSANYYSTEFLPVVTEIAEALPSPAAPTANSTAEFSVAQAPPAAAGPWEAPRESTAPPAATSSAEAQTAPAPPTAHFETPPSLDRAPARATESEARLAEALQTTTTLWEAQPALTPQAVTQSVEAPRGEAPPAASNPWEGQASLIPPAAASTWGSQAPLAAAAQSPLTAPASVDPQHAQTWPTVASPWEAPRESTAPPAATSSAEATAQAPPTVDQPAQAPSAAANPWESWGYQAPPRATSSAEAQHAHAPPAAASPWETWGIQVPPRATSSAEAQHAQAPPAAAGPWEAPRESQAAPAATSSAEAPSAHQASLTPPAAASTWGSQAPLAPAAQSPLTPRESKAPPAAANSAEAQSAPAPPTAHFETPPSLDKAPARATESEARLAEALQTTTTPGEAPPALAPPAVTGSVEVPRAEAQHAAIAPWEDHSLPALPVATKPMEAPAEKLATETVPEAPLLEDLPDDPPEGGALPGEGEEEPPPLDEEEPPSLDGGAAAPPAVDGGAAARPSAAAEPPPAVERPAPPSTSGCFVWLPSGCTGQRFRPIGR
ncbi:unnamed protein product, partial [Prorocentrum cordatum]